MNNADARMAASVVAPRDMIAFFEGGPEAQRQAEDAVAFVIAALERGDDLEASAYESVAPLAADVHLRAPVPRPRRIRDYLTYEAHASGSALIHRADSRTAIPTAR